VSLGSDFLVAVNYNGVVFTCGNNNYAQLGLRPDLDDALLDRALLGPIELNSVTNEGNAVMVSAGNMHAACVTRNGSVYTWGHGIDGQLGVAHIFRQPTPQRVYSASIGQSPATMVACGRAHTLLLTAAGHVWGCGSNVYFQVGVQSMPDPLVNNNGYISKFTMMPPARFDGGNGHVEIDFIAAGTYHSMAVGRHDGVLWTWGHSTFGRLGLGDDLISDCACVPTAVPGTTFGEAVVSVSAAKTITMAVTANGVVWATGVSMFGTLGLGETLTCHTFNRVGGHEYFGEGGVRSVACTCMHALFVAQNGSLWVCGHGNSFCLGIEVHGQVFSRPVKMNPASFHNEAIIAASVCENRSIAVTVSGGLYTWGREPNHTHSGLCLLRQGVPVYEVESEYGDVLINILYVPQKVMLMSMGHSDQKIDPFGLWVSPFSEDEQLAFAMCTHLRLGSGSDYHGIQNELLDYILRDSLRMSVVKRTAAGLRNLLGL